MRIAAYLRVSSESQSVAHQRHAIEEWATHQGYAASDITYVTDHAVSGAAGANKRPGYAGLLKSITGREVDKVLVFESSRASRDFLEYLRFLETCHKHGCELEVIGKGPVNFSTSQDMLVAAIHAFLGQAERERISERTKSGLANARAKGKRLGAPKGNRNRRGKLKEYSAAMVEEAARLRAKGLTLREVADTLGSKYTERPVSHVTVLNMLRRAG